MNKEQIRNAILDQKAVIFVLPKQELKDCIINNSDVDIANLSNDLKTYFLEGKGIAVENKMIADYIEGKLDKKNSKLLSLCEIRVVQDTINIS